MNVALPQTRLTVPEFFAWWDAQATDERFELIDGLIVAMGRDRVRHNRAKYRAARTLSYAIESAGLDCEAFLDGLGVSPDNYNFRLPDAIVHCGPVDENAAILPNPVIVVEIVSPRSEERDVHEKLADYFSIESLLHYPIVYPERSFVGHHRRTSSAMPVETRFVREGEIAFDPPGLLVSLKDLLGEADR